MYIANHCTLGFNDYEIRGDITAIIIYKRTGERFESLIDTKNLETVKALGLRWNLRYDKEVKSHYVRASETYYKEGKRKQRSVYLHIELMNPEHNPEIFVDHFNHDTLNNLEENLRCIEFYENVMHRHSKNKNNKSGYRNVSKRDN